MLIVITEKQILSPGQVCCDCLLASKKGLPRWHEGKLGCRRHQAKETKNLQNHLTNCPSQEAVSEVYECQMGFCIANIESTKETG
ncbi:MAG: hypothetical protein WA865_08405 [Spirulinaceae cyanobacterium]